jgi:putative transposase
LFSSLSAVASAGRHLANNSVHNALRESWCAATAWLVDFYLIMPDHVHLFCAPQNEDHTLEEWISFWKRRLRRQFKTLEALLQAHSFHHRLRRDESYSGKWDYVPMNPVRAGLIGDPSDGPYQGILNELPWWNWGGSAERRPTRGIGDRNSVGRDSVEPADAATDPVYDSPAYFRAIGPM